MTKRSGIPFCPVQSTAPSFSSTAGSSGLYPFEDASVGRLFQGPSNRALRVASLDSTNDFYINFGSSLIVAASSNSLLILGGSVECLYLRPSDAYVAIYSSTTVVANFSVGYGG